MKLKINPEMKTKKKNLRSITNQRKSQKWSDDAGEHDRKVVSTEEQKR